MSKWTCVISLLAVLCSYVIYKKFVTLKTSIVSEPDKRYDYIVVGGGTAGGVLAARLSEVRARVLLVEAGERLNALADVPLAAAALQQGPHDWAFVSEPQRYSSFGMWNRSQCIPRGKGLGGSGRINYMMHGFGLRSDYEEWAKLGATGWSYEDLAPYFRKAFGTVDNEYDSEKACYETGECDMENPPMKLKHIEHYTELSSLFQHGSQQTGEQSTFWRPTATLHSGARCSTYEAYLKPALARDNLHVLLNTQALSIKFHKGKAVSLYILKKGRYLDNIFVNKEIILAAGAIKTPQLLMLSGVGPKDELKRHKIKLVKSLNWVGRNFHDQMSMPLYVSIKKPISLTLAKVFTFKTLWNYIWNKSGYLAFPPIAGTEIVENATALILFTLGSPNEKLLRDLSNYRTRSARRAVHFALLVLALTQNEEVFRETFQYHNHTGREGFMLLATCLRPRSRGRVTLAGDSALRPPLIDPDYLSDPYDVGCMVKAMRRAARLVSTPSFRSVGAVLHWPRPERCAALRGAGALPPDAYLECVAREVAVGAHHAAGTCSMAAAVVDHRLRLRGLSGVRVADASVLPSPVSLYPNSVLVAVAERAADMIKKDNKE